MSLRLLASVVLVAVVVTASGGARADDCDDVTPIDGAHRVDNSVGLHAVDTIVPCALVDSGVVGPECADAFYVVNHQGTVLCRVELLAFSVDDGKPTLQRDDAESIASNAFVAVAILAPGVELPAPPLVVELSGAIPAADGGPADAHLFERPRPS